MYKRVVFSFFLFSILSFQGIAQSEYIDRIQAERDENNVKFADTATSILTDEDIPNFTGLNYYPIDSNYRIEAKYRKLFFKPRFFMQTSTDRQPVYRKYGRLKFEINGVRCKLTLYENVDYRKKHPDYDELFCPFIDESRNDKSYGGGRYLDFKIDELSKAVLIDFNRSYNPYCAYNYRYSCPIPPKENHLKVSIPAGIQKWHD